MQNKRDVSNLIIALIILFIFFIGLTNKLISSYLTDSGMVGKWHEDVAAIPVEPLKTTLQEPQDNVLTPEDPDRYNIQVLTDEDLSSLHSKIAWPMTGEKKTPKELRERLNRINRRIKDMEKTNRNGPGSQIERIELQSLYILKSSLTVLLEEATGAKTPKRK